MAGPYNIEVTGKNQLNARPNLKVLAFWKLIFFVIFGLIVSFAAPIDYLLYDQKLKLILLFAFFVLLYQLLDILYIASTAKKVQITFIDNRYIVQVERNNVIEVSSFKSLKVLIKPIYRYSTELIIDLHWEDGFVRLGRPIDNEQTQALILQIEEFTGLKAEKKMFTRKRRQYGYPYTSKPEEENKN